MKMNLLFINAIDTGAEIESHYPPLGIGYLCSSLRQYFGNERIQFRVADSRIQEAIADFKPHLIGISSVSQNYNKALKYSGLAKSLGIPVICGGVHISMLPSSLGKDMDIGVIGEGEETICEILELFMACGKFCDADLSRIKGIVYHNAQAELVQTQPRGLIAPLDKIQFPARDLFSIKTKTYMFTSRGCPYRCVFCSSSRFWNNVRFFSAEYVVKEIAYLVNTHQVQEINLYDDLFALDIKRIKKIRDLLAAEHLLGRIKFFSAMRANLVTDEAVGILKEIGVAVVAMGLESGCQRTLEYLKPSVNVGDNQQAINTIKRHGLAVYASFIIGSPQEGKKDILQTLAFVKNNQFDGFSVYPLTPLPGTPVWSYAQQRGLVGDRMDWDKLSVRLEDNCESFIVLSEKLTRTQLCELYRLFKRYSQFCAAKKEILSLVRKGLRHPLRIPEFLIKKCNVWRQRG